MYDIFITIHCYIHLLVILRDFQWDIKLSLTCHLQIFNPLKQFNTYCSESVFVTSGMPPLPCWVTTMKTDLISTIGLRFCSMQKMEFPPTDTMMHFLHKERLHWHLCNKWWVHQNCLQQVLEVFLSQFVWPAFWRLQGLVCSQQDCDQKSEW